MAVKERKNIKDSKEEKYNKIIGIAFVAVLFLGLIAGIILPDKEMSKEENRLLEKSPKLTAESYFDGRFAKKSETYLQDQFPAREYFVKMKIAEMKTLGQVSFNGVFKGKDNYLMEELNVPSDEWYKETLKSLKEFKKKNRNRKIYFLIAPNSANILSDKMPFLAFTGDQNKALDKMFKEIDDIGIKPIDVRKSLKAEAEKANGEQIYYKTDHHWTTTGAYIAYKDATKVMGIRDDISYEKKIVSNSFRGSLIGKSSMLNGEDDLLEVYTSNKAKDSIVYDWESKEKNNTFYKWDYLKDEEKYKIFGGDNHPVFTIETPVNNGKTLLLIKDSYANCMLPFLSQQYKKIVVVDPRYYYDSIYDLTRSEKADDILFLFNGNTLFEDNSLSLLLED